MQMATASPDHWLSTTQPFCYPPLDRSKQSLRLFKVSQISNDDMLVCNLRQAEMTENYIALSYVWGSEEPSHNIRVYDADTKHEGLLKVRANLFNFLTRAASSERSVSFWTDAICIDQQNILEVNHQVGQMDAIYRSAGQVRIWLGEDPQTGAILSAMSVVADSAICSVDDLFDERCCPAEFKDDFERTRRIGFLRNRYWSRSWIVQEILLAKTIFVQSADGRTSWSNLIGLIAPHEDEQSPMMQKLVADWQAVPPPMQRYPLEYVLENFGDTQCEKIHDRLYAFLALIEGGEKLAVDYAEPPSALFARAVKVLDVKSDGILPLLKALQMDTSSLYDQCELGAQDLQKTQRILAENQHVLVTKLAFPLCSADDPGPCEWSTDGTGRPCVTCHATIKRICEMPECAHGWLTQVVELLALNEQTPGTFSNTYLSHFKNWLCSMWPDELAGVHDSSKNHCIRCYACDLRKKTYDRGEKEPRTMEEIEARVRSELEPMLASLGLRRGGPLVRLSDPVPQLTAEDMDHPLYEIISKLGPNVVMGGFR